METIVLLWNIPKKIKSSPTKLQVPGKLKLAKENMKIVIAFSPIGDKLRKRINKFSNLISCCYIDWYNVWSDDALISIALKEI